MSELSTIALSQSERVLVLATLYMRRDTIEKRLEANHDRDDKEELDALNGLIEKVRAGN